MVFHNLDSSSPNVCMDASMRYLSNTICIELFPSNEEVHYGPIRWYNVRKSTNDCSESGFGLQIQPELG